MSVVKAAGTVAVVSLSGERPTNADAIGARRSRLPVVIVIGGNIAGCNIANLLSAYGRYATSSTVTEKRVPWRSVNGIRSPARMPNMAAPSGLMTDTCCPVG